MKLIIVALLLLQLSLTFALIKNEHQNWNLEQAEERESKTNLKIVNTQRELRGRRSHKRRSYKRKYQKNYDQWSTRNSYNYGGHYEDDHDDHNTSQDYYYYEEEDSTSTYPSQNSAGNSSSSSSSSSISFIIPIVITVLVFVGIVIVVARYLLKKKKRAARQFTPLPSTERVVFGGCSRSIDYEKYRRNSRPNSAQSSVGELRSTQVGFSLGLSTCSICLDTIEQRNERVLKCGHSFHTSCIRAWRMRSNSPTCPLCRHNI